MKFHAARLLFFLLPSIPTVLCLSSGPSPDIAHSTPGRPLDPATDADHALPNTPVKSSKLDQGTKYAPHDGNDGMPHVGPNIRPLDDGSPKKKPSDAVIPPTSKEKQHAEDSVMNDLNRKAPKKGTTGTEGGVSEKDRTRKEIEAITGERLANKPEGPKEMPAKTAFDLDTDVPEKEFSAEKVPPKNAAKAETAEKKGAPGIKKPENLPDTPHEISRPLPASMKSKSFAAKKDEHSDDDEDDADFDDVVEDVKWDALVGSFTSIAATEIGDKTFIVAALMAMRHPRLQVFSAAFSALFVMTILSALTGHAVGALISKRWASLLAAVLFFVFGAKSLREGFEMDPDQGVGEEIREVQAELDEKEIDIARQETRRRASSISPYALESGNLSRSRSRSKLDASERSPSTSPSGSPSGKSKSLIGGIKNLLGLLLSPAWVETFSMTFIGELGDRSQIATVAMAAGQEYFWIMVGATLGHFVCTAAAVIGGSVLAGRITMRKITLIGGAIFIGFGLFTLFEAMQNWR